VLLAQGAAPVDQNPQHGELPLVDHRPQPVGGHAAPNPSPARAAGVAVGSRAPSLLCRRSITSAVISVICLPAGASTRPPAFCYIGLGVRLAADR
jgi:hypothetical protein